MFLDLEFLEVLDVQFDVYQELLGLDYLGGIVDFVVVESIEDFKVLSSEEEEEEFESFLFFFVLDQVSVIVERFVSSFFRRSSLALEDSKLSGFGISRFISRSSSVFSLEGSEKGLVRGGSILDFFGFQFFQEVDIIVGAVMESGFFVNGIQFLSLGCLVELDKFFCKKKEFMFFIRDRLLLDKIKSYYENVEYYDAGFSIRRRESFFYIFKGLVRNFVFRFNSFFKSDSELVVSLGYKRQVGFRSVSWVLFDFLGLGEAGVGELVFIIDVEFRLFLEIVKIWEGMEFFGGSFRKGLG